MLRNRVDLQEKFTSPADFLLMRLPRLPYLFSTEKIAETLINLNEHDAWVLVNITERGYHLNQRLIKCYLDIFHTLNEILDDSQRCLSQIKESLSKIFSAVYDDVYNDQLRDDISYQIASYTLDLICQKKDISINSQQFLLKQIIDMPIFRPWSNYSYYSNWLYSFYISDSHLTDAQKTLKQACESLQHQLTTLQQPSSLQLK